MPTGRTKLYLSTCQRRRGVDFFQTILIHRWTVAFTEVSPTQNGRVFTSHEVGLGVPTTLLTFHRQEYHLSPLPLWPPVQPHRSTAHD